MNILIDNRAETIFLRIFHPIPPARTFSIVPFRVVNHKWRSSLAADDKCHPSYRIVCITSASREGYGKQRAASLLNGNYAAAMPSSADGPYKAGTVASFNRR